MDNSVITFDEIIYAKKKTNLNERYMTCKTQNFYILLAFSLITVEILIAVSIFCCLVKHRTKQKHLLPFHVTKLKQI